MRRSHRRAHSRRNRSSRRGRAPRGNFAVWGGFNQNNKSVNGTFTFNVTGRFDDGSRLSVHSVDHLNTTPTGVEFFFSRCRA